MPENITKYKIFLASPSDLSIEREATCEVINELNIAYGPKNNYVLELLKWETHAVPGIATNHVQGLINDDIGQNYDLFIGILWTKFGTPTHVANSGTEEEFNLAYERFLSNPNQIKVLFYFKNAPMAPSDINPEQLIKVQNFKKSLEDKKVLYGEFDSVEIFKKYLRMHIPHRIEEIKISNDDLILEEDLTIEDIPEELGLIDYKENYINYLDLANQSLIRITQDTEWIGSEITKSANDLTRFNKQQNRNQHVLRSILHRTASSMDDYTRLLKSESPIFYSNYEGAIDSGIGFLNVISDFANESNIEELEGIKDEISDLRMAILTGIDSMSEFFSSVSELPRIEQKINKSRENMSSELNDFIVKLKEVLRLTEEFSKQIGKRIDEMKLKLN